MHKFFHLVLKTSWKCIFGVIQMFLSSLGVAVDKMCVSHANEIGIYIMHFILFQND